MLTLYHLCEVGSISEQSPPLGWQAGQNAMKVYVGNLDFSVDEKILKGALKGCNVAEIKWGEDKETGQFKG